ncbi:hypothetical protein [Wolbachia endosymbiont (group A) of Colletes cunicularius]|uniref:hypothetical protein n=1 Tax=Wolbachia endosymbiont (group A) of Colletes cunicularius TaxID=3139321 RepID=UPI0035C8DC93
MVTKFRTSDRFSYFSEETESLQDCSPTFKVGAKVSPFFSYDPEKDLVYNLPNNPIDGNSEIEEDSSSDCNIFEQESLLRKLEVSSDAERKLIDEFCNKVKNVDEITEMSDALMYIKNITDEYIEKGIRLNLIYGEEEITVTELIFQVLIATINNEGLGPGGKTIALRNHLIPYNNGKSNTAVKEIPYYSRYSHDDLDRSENDEDDGRNGILEGENQDVVKHIINSLFLTGGKIQTFYLNSGEITHITLQQDYLSNGTIDRTCRRTKSKIRSLACQSIAGNSDKSLQNKLKVELDNRCLYVKYIEGSIVKPAKLMCNKEKMDLGLKACILDIEGSLIRIENVKGKRNYVDILKGRIQMSFTTEVGEISIDLSPSKEGGNKIEVEIDDEGKARLNKLKAEKKSLGENCLLGGKSVLEAIEDKGFKKNGNVPTESIETIKDVPFTDFTQACSQQINTSVKGR